MKNEIYLKIIDRIQNAVFPDDMNEKDVFKHLEVLVGFTLVKNIESIILMADYPDQLMEIFESFLKMIHEASHTILKTELYKSKDSKFIEQFEEIIKNKMGIKPNKVH